MDNINLDEIATVALDEKTTDECFVKHRELFVEVAARWIQDGQESDSKIAAFGRILPHAPHLAEHAERFLAGPSQSYILAAPSPTTRDFSNVENAELLAGLLGAFRLLSYDSRTFAKYVRANAFGTLFYHARRDIRYLAVRLYSLYVHAADFATEEIRKRYVGDHSIHGEWEGIPIDYRFLSLWEEKRWSEMSEKLQNAGSELLVSPKSKLQLSSYSVNIHGVLLPRLDGESSREKPGGAHSYAYDRVQSQEDSFRPPWVEPTFADRSGGLRQDITRAASRLATEQAGYYGHPPSQRAERCKTAGGHVCDGRETWDV